MAGAAVAEQGDVAGRVSRVAVGQVTQVDANKGEVNGEVAIAAAIAIGIWLGTDAKPNRLATHAGGGDAGAVVVVIRIVIDRRRTRRIDAADQRFQCTTRGKVRGPNGDNVCAGHEISKAIVAVEIGGCRQQR